MGKHSALPTERLLGGLLLGAAASGALAMMSLQSPGVASATCASISGVGNGNGCTSSATNFAIGLGPATVATANKGLFNGALAIGSNVTAIAGNTPTSNFNLAAVVGSSSGAFAGNGSNNIAITLGNGSQTLAGSANNTVALVLGNGSVANPLASPNSVAFVIGNQSSAVTASGPANQFAGVIGNNSHVLTNGIQSVLVAIGDNKTLP